MKRYLVFKGPRFYPCGGWEDFAGSFVSLDDAISKAGEGQSFVAGWAHVVDLETEQIVWEV
jgi:hypothetical protein